MVASISIPFLSGVLAFISPCIIPMIAVYLSLITGMSVEEITTLSDKSAFRKDLMLKTALFILGFGIIFTLAGGVAGYVGKLLISYRVIFNLIGGVFIMFLGLKMTGLVKLPAIRIGGLSSKIGKVRAGLGSSSAFLVGVFFAVACSHCIGPMLYSILLYAGNKGSVYGGMLILAAFSAGLAVPYLITAYALSHGLDLLVKFKGISKRAAVASGVFLVAIGIFIALGKLPLITQFMYKVLPYRLPLGM